MEESASKRAKRAHPHAEDPELALAELVATIFSINAWFSREGISKINRDKCLKNGGSKIYLAINASTSGHEHGCRNIHSF
eukprot:2983806-Prymnesium_polylepis.1